MNNWDRVEKKGKVYTDNDVHFEYVKMVLWLLAGMAYAYFIILGKTF
tara:strand:- start:351 stop:491 length:141 start_codon:yes stop_codon:yes gene_type:complete